MGASVNTAGNGRRSQIAGMAAGDQLALFYTVSVHVFRSLLQEQACEN